MNTSSLPKFLFVTLAAGGLLTQTASALITIETVPVGNAGNEADPTTGYGAVGYDYGIGKYEVTLNQYTAFLNAVGADDTYGLYHTRMATEIAIMGIARSGASGSYSYSVIGSGNRPVTLVSWYDSARFVNWLHNGQPVGLQTAGTTETGSYTLTGNSGVITRNSGATYSLPSEDEWYKAAYYQPVTLGGDSDNYWRYPTANNAIPNSRNGSLTDPNSANYYYNDGIVNGLNGGYAVSGTPMPPTSTALTDVGAFSLASSFYGTFDQGGNVFEWNDAVTTFGARGFRGGSWSSDVADLRAFNGYTSTPLGAGFEKGFRVALVPEPSVGGLMVLGMALVAWKRKGKVEAEDGRWQASLRAKV